MKRVYLDQNKWIDLTAAMLGLRKGRRYEDVLAVLRAGVGQGLISLPLSSVHYMETANRRDWESRVQLAATMAALSRYHTIAPASVLIPPELDRALVMFGSRVPPRPLQPFGYGVAHAFREQLPPYRAPTEIELPPGVRWQIEQSASALREWALLAGPPPAMEKELEGYDPKAHLPVAMTYAQRQEQLRALRVSEGWHRGERAERVFKAEALADNVEVMNEALERARISAAVIYDAGRDGMSKLLEATPTLHALSELRRLRSTASQKQWEPNDLGDLSALPQAIVYCDVVVTERSWVAAARRAKLDELHGTVVLADLADLARHLV